MRAIKQGLLAVVAAGIAAAAPAVAAADQWEVGGTLLTGTAMVEGESTLSITAQAAPGVFITTTCDVLVTAEIWNDSGTGAGEVSMVDVTYASCMVTGLPFCRVGSVNSNLPWTFDVLSDTRVEIGGIDFTTTLANDGGSCALAGARQILGSVTGSWNNSTSELEFNNATGMSIVGMGPTVVNGNLYLEEEGTGAPISLAP